MFSKIYNQIIAPSLILAAILATLGTFGGYECGLIDGWHCLIRCGLSLVFAAFVIWTWGGRESC